ncbi:uncharacterized protein LOC131646784 [Vicia villosa]|uniref:uncharacterized protein LOC131646784 n=1 Tax=Vicia villosa TaxID=3911 RepID=UPI00273BCF73|nr:uncharacterized protein LOC131646784 [Vicia villosa]
MEAFNFKPEKLIMSSTYNIFTGITKTLRLLELCLVLLFFFWILNRLPFALSISADFLRSPLFIFALSNAIIVALLFSSSSAADSASPVEERLECQDKQIRETCSEDVDSCAVTVTDSGNLQGKVYCRSQSLPEITNEEGENEKDTSSRKLQRSETETKVREILYPQDKLSNEEFQRTIEAFIAKQMRFLREEELC